MSAKKTSFEDGTKRFQGKVKWFSERRGYGFIEVDGDEVFIHRSALLAFGLYRLQNEDLVTVSLTTTERGQIVNCLFGIERPPIPPQLIAETPDEDEEIATVKFFNDSKGYGFIMIDGHDEDIFIHSRVLEDNGLAMLDTGQKILVRVEDGERGEQVSTIRFYAQGNEAHSTELCAEEISGNDLLRREMQDDMDEDTDLDIIDLSEETS